ncbi:MAG: T9SS type A sorting domain-containing protein [Flavobacteriales bacterium]|nr:T9SS type A sorting domain-containing protein [Flavobacteriales bacterium]
MKHVLSIIAFLPLFLSAQYFNGRQLVLEEVTVPGMPALQSFAWGQYDGQWFLIGGRTDGLHRRQPPVAFLAADNNSSAYVVDPTTLEVWSASIASLPQGLLEQLQSTNMQFEQRGNVLYCTGGYGYSLTAQDHITYPKLTAIDLPGVMSAIRNGQPIDSYFRQITDTRFEVTGGQMRLVGDQFYLVGGQRFVGRYNPQGPTFGPGFIQEYTNAIRRFAINDDGVDLAISDYWTVVDTVNLHRRDYNMLPQVFPDGSEGLTVFSGVFQYDTDLPWLNTVDIVGNSYTVVPGFEQLLNQYHSAHAAVFDAPTNTMYSLFFGGIGRYYYNGSTLMDDTNVPFVSTISLITRDSNGAMEETAIGNMPALLGASAEFLPWTSTPQMGNGILQLDQFSGDTVVAGHIVGGIQSSAPNIFFINTGTQSDATPRVFRVLLVESSSTGVNVTDASSTTMRMVREGSNLIVQLSGLTAGATNLRLIDTTGRELRTLVNAVLPGGDRSYTIPLAGLAQGAYMMELSNGGRQISQRFIR